MRQTNCLTWNSAKTGLQDKDCSKCHLGITQHSLSRYSLFFSPETQDFGTQLQSIAIDMIDTQHNVLDDIFPSAWPWQSFRPTVDQWTGRPSDQTGSQCHIVSWGREESKYENRFPLPLHATLQTSTYKNKILLTKKMWKQSHTKELY